MSRRLTLIPLILIMSAGVFAIPRVYQDPYWSGAFEGGVLVSLDPLSGKMSLGGELLWISPARIGVGITSFVALKLPLTFDSWTLDGVYYLSTGQNEDLDIPIKLRVGLFDGASGGSLGVGVATGLEWFAVPFEFDDSDNMYVSNDPTTSGFFLSLKGLAELDYVRGGLRSSLSFGSALSGTIGGEASGSGGYVYYVYY